MPTATPATATRTTRSLSPPRARQRRAVSQTHDAGSRRAASAVEVDRERTELDDPLEGEGMYPSSAATAGIVPDASAAVPTGGCAARDLGGATAARAAGSPGAGRSRTLEPRSRAQPVRVVSRRARAARRASGRRARVSVSCVVNIGCRHPLLTPLSGMGSLPYIRSETRHARFVDSCIRAGFYRSRLDASARRRIRARPQASADSPSSARTSA